jgi:taurine dioxygenase
MLTVEPTGAVLGATIRGLNAAEPISDHDLGVILAALGRHGVLRIPEQSLAEDDIRRFSQMFGDIQGPSGAPLGPDGKEVPHVGILSNIKENGKYIGAADAGQDWHTDMSYRDVIGFVNILYGVKVPVRDRKPLGGTEFSNMHAVYDALPDELKRRLADATTTHDFEKFWEHMRRDKASGRPPMTEEQRRRRPPVKHPLFMTHPITGKKVLYCNPGYVTRINELPAAESDALLEYLFDFQLQDRFRYTHQWAERDLLIWDHIGTIHRAIADYGPDEIRLMRRCQVMATKVFDPAFAGLARAA